MRAGDGSAHCCLDFVQLRLGLYGGLLRLPQAVAHGLDLHAAVLRLLLLGGEQPSHTLSLLLQNLQHDETSGAIGM